MLFASSSLVARIERAECRLLSACVAAIARRRDGVEMFVKPVAGGVAIFTVDDSPLNKIAGMGFAGPLDEAELEVVERRFERHGAKLQVELASLAEPSIGVLLTRRGYRLEGFENVLGLPLPASPGPAQLSVGTEIETNDDAELDAWIDVIVTGFASPDTQGVPSHAAVPRDTLTEIIRDMASADGFVRYLARRDGVPVGGASMHRGEGVAHMCGAATLPAHRRRGVQSALLRERLVQAAADGCDVAVVITMPGSKSQENAQRRGFELLYNRAILVRGG